MRPKTILTLAPALVLAVALAGCGDSTPPVTYAPLDYSYLPPIMLKVVNVNFQNNYVPDPGAAALLSQDPEPPATAVLTMAQHRLVANGTPGTATFTIENASVEQNAGNLVGTLTVRVDVVSADGRAKGYTEASVSHSQTAPDSSSSDAMQAALYSMTKQLMDAMNVQLQYQLQHNLGSWIAYSNSAAAAPVSTTGAVAGGIVATPLTGPPTGGAIMSPATPSGLAPGVHNLVPPSMAH
ncbi:MAG: hypothetical protein B7Z75_01495 [Acidocella sp. 20-57-95]|nr:MAG: hypothetical protein B7Z75_01495 [Acidocella sp. 20-57-95]OYV62717.1 MAG: hypothetical protein B7Z71_00045 [Acidocella sp. 21-58-7]HQT65381.1 hypothetical protein [Acidocella sp.]HQU03268.1 hypothetical protein [Acidocella sp.]